MSTRTPITIAAVLGVSAATGLAGAAVSSTPAAATPAAVTTAAPAAASTAARSASTKRLIIRAVTSQVASSSDITPKQFSVGSVRQSKVDPRWARAVVSPKKGVQLDPADVVVHRDAKGWIVKDLGTDQVGCGIAPTKVARSLALGCD